MDIPWFLQEYQMREGKGFNLLNYSVSPGNIVNPCRHDSRTNKKQMLGNQVLSAVVCALSPLVRCCRREKAREEAGEQEREID